MVEKRNTQEIKVDAAVFAHDFNKLPEKEKLVLYGMVKGILLLNEPTELRREKS